MNIIFQPEMEQILNLEPNSLQIDSLHHLRATMGEREFQLATYMIAQRMIDCAVTGKYQGAFIELRYPDLKN